MTALDRNEDEHTARLEQRALEKMTAAICADVARRIETARAHGTLESRESGLQAQAFAERRKQAMELLSSDTSEPREIRITRLEKMVEALARSREYFRALDDR